MFVFEVLGERNRTVLFDHFLCVLRIEKQGEMKSKLERETETERENREKRKNKHQIHFR